MTTDSKNGQIGLPPAGRLIPPAINKKDENIMTDTTDTAKTPEVVTHQCNWDWCEDKGEDIRLVGTGQHYGSFTAKAGESEVAIAWVVDGDRDQPHEFHEDLDFGIDTWYVNPFEVDKEFGDIASIFEQLRAAAHRIVAEVNA